MKQIIQDQTISFDTHQAGDGQEINIDGLHMHKRMNSKKFKGVNIRIPLNPDEEISYSGNNSKLSNEIINEIKTVFKKNPAKVREMAKTLAGIISRYSKDMNAKNSKEFTDNSAKAIAKHFDLNEDISGKLDSGINKHLSFVITSHEDENGKLYYIKQDISRKRIKIGDNLEKILYGNAKYK